MNEPTPAWASALGRIPSGLTIVTVRQGLATTGMLASWVQQCSFDPPLVSFALRKGRPVSEWLGDDGQFTVNIIGEDQKKLAAHFGKGFDLNEPAFDGIPLIDDVENAPIIESALGYLTCKVQQRVPVGDHDLIIGHIYGGGMQGEGKPVVHIRKNGLHY